MIHWMELLCYVSIISTFFFVKNIYADTNAREPKIIGGKNAVLGQFPYTVSIQQNDVEHNCGGGIIDDRYILTAAHCIISTATKELFDVTMKVVLNSVNLLDDPGLRVDVEKAYVLKKYNSSIKEHDIGILKLKESLDLANSRLLKKLDLPRSPETRRYVGKIGVVTGFGYIWIDTYYDNDGKLQESDGFSHQKLKFASVKIITNEECALSGYWTGDRKVTTNHICGYVYQHDPYKNPEGVCSGDSGSPLVVGNTVVGIVSVSPKGCNESVNAAKYTRVSQYLNFIQAVLKGRLNSDILEFNIPQPDKSSEEIDRGNCTFYPHIPGFHPNIPGCP